MEILLVAFPFDKKYYAITWHLPRDIISQQENSKSSLAPRWDRDVIFFEELNFSSAEIVKVKASYFDVSFLVPFFDLVIVSCDIILGFIYTTPTADTWNMLQHNVEIWHKSFWNRGCTGRKPASVTWCIPFHDWNTKNYLNCSFYICFTAYVHNRYINDACVILGQCAIFRRFFLDLVKRLACELRWSSNHTVKIQALAPSTLLLIERWREKLPQDLVFRSN